MTGYIHIYCGDGKGKTTAAVGLGIRAAGCGIPVIFVQFMKDSSSGEVKILQDLPQITVLHIPKHFGFYDSMTEEQKVEAKTMNSELFVQAITLGKMKAVSREDKKEIGALLILDEAIGAYNCNLIEKEVFLNFLHSKPENLEVVLTGRDPGKELLEAANYISYIQKIKHPYDDGILARKGIEK